MIPSSRVTPQDPARHPDATRPPHRHTEPELAALLRLATDLSGPGGVAAIGHGRHPASRAAAAAFVGAWRDLGGHIAAVVDWPARAASWLRPARRLTAAAPDVWVIADTPTGWAQLARRLQTMPGWDPWRTLGFAALGTCATTELAGTAAVSGMAGATATGDTWRLVGRCLSRTHIPPHDLAR